MGNDLKYVIVKDGNCELPILFPATIDHVKAAFAFKRHIVSAGFCRLSVDNAFTIVAAIWGKSVSLGDISSRPEDAAVLERHLNDH